VVRRDGRGDGVERGTGPRASSAGIVVAAAGRVIFGDLSRGLLRVERDGRVTKFADEGGHWLALDEKGGFAGMEGFPDKPGVRLRL
jgi:hypothetical protein